jgi:hydroxyacylglutathione hydrolase
MIQIHSFTFGPFSENTYILSNAQKEAIIIDPGMYDLSEFDSFFKYLTDKDLKPVLLLNTHTHIDHIVGNAAVKMKYKVPFAFHELDRPVFDHQSATGAMYNLTFVTSPEPDYYLQEGESVQLGEHRLQVLLTPGHSPGSVCFYHEGQQFVISGDVLFQQSIGRTDLPGGDYKPW